MASEEGDSSELQEATIFDTGVEQNGGFSGAADEEDDFGDFGDFELDDFSNTSELHTPLTTIMPTQNHPSIESVLTRGGALFGQSAEDGIQTEALEDCLAHVFGSPSNFIEEKTTESLPQVDLLSKCQIESYISKISRGPALEETEPRLLRNMLVVAMRTDLSDEYKELLLTPLSQLESRINVLGKISPTNSLLALDEIRQISTLELDFMESDTRQIEQLQHALDSITQLIETKEQEITKQNDSISAYNQVIQTLVAQASKLH
ncbi:hypothetical protein COEREDRAFT_5506 [Coemansia reversa NRRL 1564]|uniref:Uncharacterized protein n=1 Tax=Coemansia reversa (strain ATCC 12441 / NRRL 1564) TaxID=763665 RepID=A0A2G5BL49_COERN|nr:hypothetical protein COEREDRAFT_5506 [Coemansia reversa NRRL 1564]|eukprot:PIA19692.1 hypothetical protein COEREDRAFT_5506 [Coemansia reversa NRRL 1564]